MHFELERGISACDVGGRLIFLDLPADRYFCLASETEEAVRKLIRADPLGADDLTRLDGLIDRRVLRRSNGGAISVCPGADPAALSLLEGPLPDPTHWQVAAAAGAAIASIVRLRVRPLIINLAGAAPSRGAVPYSEEEHLTRLMRLASAFDRATYLLSSHDRCLAQSLAVARTARRAGLTVQLVFGVALGPFVAHCWVQSGTVVINDRLDTIRDYKPILVR